MATKVDYLKKYLSSQQDGDGGQEEKKKKKKKIKKLRNLVIHDQDLDMKKMAPMLDDDMDDDPEEAPIVIDITGDDPETNFRWKAVQPANPVNLAIVKVERNDSPEPEEPAPSSKDKRRESSLDTKPKKRKIEQDQDPPDFSPPRRKKSNSPPADFSPPRRKRKQIKPNSRQVGEAGHAPRRHDSKSPEPENLSARKDSPDLSPPRKDKPLRRDSTNRPTPKRSRLSSSQSDLSPPRSRLASGQSDLSPPRHNPPEQSGNRTLSGTKAGLVPSDTVKKEIQRANAERDRFIKSLEPLVSGRNAATVYRDKEGKRIDPNAPETPLTEEELRRKREADETFAQWGRGVTQVQSAEDKLADDLYEMSKPLARYRDDEDLEKLLKEREREGDPMLKFLTKKQKKKRGKNKEEKIARINRPTYQGSWSQNRFSIPPGYRWDGVDRSNGFENARYARKAEKESLKEFAYKWSVENM